MPLVTVVVPTLNESGNIIPLVDRLASAFKDRTDWEILFVDDGSRDGTVAEIGRAARHHPVRLIERAGERGLATAVLKGFASTDAPTVMVMDADLSHPPEMAPRLAEEVERGADVAIGSRYVPGGGTAGWSRVRLFLSRGASFLTRGLTPVRDSGAGFFAIRKSLLSGVTLKVEGFKILLEILATLRPAKVVEVPIHFAPRHAGSSKAAVNVGIDYVLQLGRLYAARPAAHVVAAIVVLFALKVAIGGRVELDSVEAYHWLYAQHPALGYYDHPGMIGWLVWLSTALFGDSPLGVRMLTFIGSGVATWLVFLTGRRLYDERTGRLAAFLMAIAFGTLKFGSMATPDAPLLLFWFASLWALAHVFAGDRSTWWYAAGAFLGMAMLSKYTAVFLPMGVLLYLLTSSVHRSWLRRKEPWLAALIVMALSLPTLVWNAQNGWQSLEYQGIGRLSGAPRFDPRHLRDFVVAQVLLLTPIIPLWGWPAAVSAFRRSKPWADRFVACAALPMLVFFLGVACLRSVRGHWMLVGGATLFLLTTAVVIRSSRLGRFMHSVSIGLCLAAALLTVATVFLKERGAAAGWSRLAGHVDELKPAFTVAQDYHVAAHLAYHLRPKTAVDFTSVGAGGKSFSNWWKAEEHSGQDAVIVWEKVAYPKGLDLVRARFEHLGDPVEVSVPRHNSEAEAFILVRARKYRPTAKADIR